MWKVIVLIGAAIISGVVSYASWVMRYREDLL